MKYMIVTNHSKDEVTATNLSCDVTDGKCLKVLQNKLCLNEMICIACKANMHWNKLLKQF